MKTIFASVIALGLFTGAVAAKSPQDIFTDISRTAPKSISTKSGTARRARRSTRSTTLRRGPSLMTFATRHRASGDYFTRLQRNAP